MIAINETKAGNLISIDNIILYFPVIPATKTKIKAGSINNIAIKASFSM
jgi:hypothetical protein